MLSAPAARRAATLRLARFPLSSTSKVLARRITSTSSTETPSRSIRRAAAVAATLVSGTLFAVYYFDSRSAIHRYVFTPTLRYGLDSESSHKFAVKVLRSGMAPRDMGVDDERLSVEILGERLSNPIGLAAGFDKNGEAIDGLFNLGFSWVEIGSVTPKPQPGNPKPRVFHLPDDSAMINRYGFPSDGSVSVLSRLRARIPSIFTSPDAIDNLPPSPASLRQGALLAINLGKNKSSPPESIADFVSGVRTFGPYADVLVVNVSSPNTPGLRGLQTRGMLEELLAGVAAERNTLPLSSQTITRRLPKLVLKVAPDLSEEELMGIAEVIKGNSSVDAVIVSNTTIQRPATLTEPNKIETGGLSGAPLKPITLKALRTLRSHLPASIPIIGCGGISSGADALDYARAGASFVQVYTVFGYDGVGACRRIKDELTEALAKEGTTWAAVVKDATERLSEKPSVTLAKKDALDAGSVEVEGLRTLIEEALSIRSRLEKLSEELGPEQLAEVFPPNNTTP